MDIKPRKGKARNTKDAMTSQTMENKNNKPNEDGNPTKEDNTRTTVILPVAEGLFNYRYYLYAVPTRLGWTRPVCLM